MRSEPIYVIGLACVHNLGTGHLFYYKYSLYLSPKGFDSSYKSIMSKVSRRQKMRLYEVSILISLLCCCASSEGTEVNTVY